MSELAELRQRVVELERSESEHVRSKKKLRKRERYLHSILQNIEEDIVVIDRDHGITADRLA